MEIKPIFNDEIIALVVFVFGYLVYYFSYESKFVLQLAKKLGDTEKRIEYSIHLPRLIGFVTLGVVPFVLVLLFFDQPLTAYGFQWMQGSSALLIGLVLIVLSAAVPFLQSEKGIYTDFYPQIRLERWTKRDHVMNVLSWTIYLLGYEFILRGPLFFACLHAFGLIPAIAINSVIYSLIHIYKGKGEAFGAFFFGILLCVVAYQTNSFVIPFVVHVILAVGNDWKALKATKAHPQTDGLTRETNRLS